MAWLLPSRILLCTSMTVRTNMWPCCRCVCNIISLSLRRKTMKTDSRIFFSMCPQSRMNNYHEVLFLPWTVDIQQERCVNNVVSTFMRRWQKIISKFHFNCEKKKSVRTFIQVISYPCFLRIWLFFLNILKVLSIKIH